MSRGTICCPTVDTATTTSILLGSSPLCSISFLVVLALKNQFKYSMCLSVFMCVCVSLLCVITILLAERSNCACALPQALQISSMCSSLGNPPMFNVHLLFGVTTLRANPTNLSSIHLAHGHGYLALPELDRRPPAVQLASPSQSK